MQNSVFEVQQFLKQLYGPNTRFENSDLGPKNAVIIPYGYNVSIAGLAQNQTQTVQLVISANADFIFTAASYRAAIAAAQSVSTKTAAFVRLLITDSGTNQPFTNSAVDLENYASNGSFNRSMQYPRFISGRASLTFQFTNYAPTAETYSSLDFYLSGYNVQLYN